MCVHPYLPSLHLIFYSMSRRRRVDKKILDLDGPIDSDDQELLISELSARNDDAYSVYSLVLQVSIVLELLPLVLLARTSPDRWQRTWVLVLLVLSCLLCFVNARYDVAPVARNWSLPARRLVTFTGVNCINATLLAQLLYAAVVKLPSFAKALYCLVPVGNLATVILIRHWHNETAGQVGELQGLRYKFKSV